MRWRLPLLTALLLLGSGCEDTDGSPGPFGGVSGDDGEFGCDGSPGAPAVELIRDDERHVPVTDGDVYAIARRPQGDVTIFAPLTFSGLDGGEVVQEFSIVFVDDDGEERGARRSVRFQLPCEDDGDVAGHWYEVFFGNPTIPASTYHGLHGTLTVQFLADGDLITDDASVSLRAE